MVAVNEEASRNYSETVAEALRHRGISAEVSHTATKFGKQIRNAERRGIPYVWFPGTGPDGEGAPELDTVKDIRSGDQRTADAKTWTPPTADLRPSVVPRGQGTTH